MMLFGVTSFGGLVNSVVTVTGLAVGSAIALAEPTVLYKGTGQAVTEAQASGTTLRSTFGSGAALAETGVVAQAKVDYLALGTAISKAFVSGHVHASYQAGGTGYTEGLAYAKAFKRTRAGKQPAAVGEAYGSGDTVIYAYGFGKPAVGSAKGIGTTWHVARGVVLGEAYARDEAIRILGTRQRAEGDSEASGHAKYQIGFAGYATSEAYAHGDASVRIGTVWYHAANGIGYAEGTAVLSHVRIYQPQRAVSDSYMQGRASYALGVKGTAVGESLARGYGVVGQTSAGYVLGLTESFAAGIPSKLAKASGAAVVSADAAGNALAKYAKKSSGTAVGTSSTQGNPAAHYSAQGIALGAGFVVTQDALRSVSATAVSINGECLGSGSAVRTCIASPSVSLIEATATGYNQVNDLVKAPATRTLVVLSEDRLVNVDAQPRLITV